MPGCAVATCKNTNRTTKGTDIKYFGFPKNEDLLKRWIHACRRKDKINLKNAHICSIHFDKESFEIPMKQRLLKYCPKTSRNLKSDAMSVLNLPGTSQKIKIQIVQAEYIKEGNRTLWQNYYNKQLLLSPNLQLLVKYQNPFRDNIKNTEANDMDKLKEKIKMLEKQNEELQQQVKLAKRSITGKYEVALAKVFTSGQIKKLVHHEKEKKNTLVS